MDCRTPVHKEDGRSYVMGLDIAVDVEALTSLIGPTSTEMPLAA